MSALDPNRVTATHVKVDGITQKLFTLELESNIDGQSVSSIYGSINVETVKCELQGDVEGKLLDITFELNGIKKHYSEFVIEECKYDDKSDKTTVIAHTDIDGLDSPLAPITSLNTNTMIMDSLKVGENVKLPNVSYDVNTVNDKYYPRRMDLYQDIASITGNYIDIKKTHGNLFPCPDTLDCFVASDGLVVSNTPTYTFDELQGGSLPSDFVGESSYRRIQIDFGYAKLYPSNATYPSSNTYTGGTK